MNTLLLAHLALGPFMLILAFLYKRFPPKSINYFYGYRTPRSMKSQGAWDCANLYSANALIFVAVITCLVQIISYALLRDLLSMIVLAAGALVLGIITTIPLTEKHLKKNGY